MNAAGTTRIAMGLFLVVASVYALSSPGRIDMIDGQLRFEVARNLVRSGRPILRDRALLHFGEPGADGSRYALYGPGASLTGMVACAVGQAFGDVELAQFLFSFTSVFLGAATASLVFLLALHLGAARRAALTAALISAFATLVWPVSTSVFDQAQHAFFVLLAIYLAVRSAERSSGRLAFAAGAAGGALLLFHESYVFLVAALASFTWSGPRRAAWQRLILYAAGASLGVAGILLWNELRFAAPFQASRSIARAEPVFGNLLIGLPGLFLSPGRSIFLYSPPVLLSMVAFASLRSSHRGFTARMLLVTTVQLLLIGSLAFWSGDWCWGPRYFVVLLPLWAVPLAFIDWRRWAPRLIVAVGVGVQVLGLSIDHHRFYYSRGMDDTFWADRQDFHFRQSQLLARISEVVELVRDGVPAEATRYAPNPYPHRPTYTTFGNARAERSQAAQWMRRYQLFHLPRPWPLWMWWIPVEDRPVALAPAIALLLMVLTFGVLQIRRGWALG